MARLVVVVLFFVAVFVGIGLGAIGVPSEIAIASGLVVVGAALLASGRVASLKEARARLPVNLSVVGGAFAVIGAVLVAAGLAA